MTETEWAIRNLELAGLFGKDSDYEGMIGEALEFAGCIADNGHIDEKFSAYSHRLVIKIQAFRESAGGE